MNKILIIDDEENMCHMLEAMLSRYGYSIDTAQDGQEATGLVARKQYDYILCDVRMPNMDGLEFLHHNIDALKNTTVIMMSAYGSIDLALEAMKSGAYDFISKPFKVDEVVLTLKKAEEREQLKKENQFLKRELGKRSDVFSTIIGKSKALQSVIDLAEKVAPYDTTVLITGESGTGKELIARGVHAASSRGEKSFYAINCGSIPSSLLESELFGYTKGAFTGADKNKKGLFEEADGSTLFLDEIGELPLDMQVKLLRVLQESQIRPLGAASERKINVRIIAATAKNLLDEVQGGEFREDLFYRLNVLAIQIPPLRERVEDIPILCEHFIDKYNDTPRGTVQSVAKDAMELLLQYDWPGNIRELENIIQRGLVLADDSVIHGEHFPQSITAVRQGSGGHMFQYPEYSIKSAQKKLEAELIAKALEETGGNKSKAAVLLEISYPSLLNKIKEYSL